MSTEQRTQPFLQVVQGIPTEEELAAVTVALLAYAHGGKTIRAGEPAAGKVGWTPVRGYCPPGAWTSR